MDVICTDANKIETGVLHNFYLDYDETDTMDYEITADISNKELEGKSMWYINDTGYGGIVDYIIKDTNAKQLTYRGKNLRGILKSKIIEPNPGDDYRIVSGNIADIVNQLLKEFGVYGLFKFMPESYEISKFKFERYIDLYSGIVQLLYKAGKVLQINVFNGVMQLSMSDRVDYSQEMEYTGENIKFKMTRGFNPVNHLICLGSGELKDRMVVHLYVDCDGDIVDKQYYFGIDEVAEVYEYSNAGSMEELKKAGIDKLGELRSTDEFEVSDVEDKKLKIGDIVGAYDEDTNYRIKREIVNITARISDDSVDIEYKVGGDEPAAAGVPYDIVEEYVLPVASNKILGGIMVGDTLDINNGKLECPELDTLNSMCETLTRLSA
jgi:hypothetical protein